MRQIIQRLVSGRVTVEQQKTPEQLMERYIIQMTENVDLKFLSDSVHLTFTHSAESVGKTSFQFIIHRSHCVAHTAPFGHTERVAQELTLATKTLITIWRLVLINFLKNNPHLKPAQSMSIRSITNNINALYLHRLFEGQIKLQYLNKKNNHFTGIQSYTPASKVTDHAQVILKVETLIDFEDHIRQKLMTYLCDPNFQKTVFTKQYNPIEGNNLTPRQLVEIELGLL